jgi:RNA-directed DNA polymerase
MDVEMTKQTEDNSASVPAGARQVEEVRSRWAWAEPSVWRDRMLTALEQGVKGGRYLRYRNVFFAEQGLFRLQTAHATVRQPSSR